MYQHAKKQFIASVHCLVTINFRISSSDWQHQFLTMPNQKYFDQLFIFVNLYQHAKKEVVSSICSVVTVDLKILHI